MLVNFSAALMSWQTIFVFAIVAHLNASSGQGFMPQGGPGPEIPWWDSGGGGSPWGGSPWGGSPWGGSPWGGGWSPWMNGGGWNNPMGGGGWNYPFGPWGMGGGWY
ncbi:unnamed protein product [Anisakis simplex]|uniref:Secreted protein n=1 Tax=Anisakis simplex TaxID=6269 RepID=A0A0M3JZR6_ANISI|nr:unnamed protein product [Anisakis simplex]